LYACNNTDTVSGVRSGRRHQTGGYPGMCLSHRSAAPACPVAGCVKWISLASEAEAVAGPPAVLPAQGSASAFCIIQTARAQSIDIYKY